MRRQGPGTHKTLSWHNRYNKYWPGARYSYRCSFALSLKFTEFALFMYMFLLYLLFFALNGKILGLLICWNLSTYVGCLYFNETWRYSDTCYIFFSFIFIFTVILSSNILMKKWVRLGVGAYQGPYIYLDPWRVPPDSLSGLYQLAKCTVSVT